MLEQQLEMYKKLSTRKSEEMSDETHRILSLYAKEYFSYTKEVSYLSFMGWLSAAPLAHSSKKSLAHTIGKFLYTFRYITHEDFDIIKSSFKSTYKSWSNKSIDKKELREFFYGVATRSANKFTGVRDTTAFLLLLVSGIRIGQLTEIEMSDITLNNDNISLVIQTKKQNTLSSNYEEDDLKIIPNDAGFFTYSIRNYIEKYLYLRNESFGEEGNLFVNLYGEPITTEYFRKVCRSLSDTITPHSFRHTAISEVAKTVGLYEAAVMANHKNIATTQRYINKQAEDISHAYRRATGSHDPERVYEVM